MSVETLLNSCDLHFVYLKPGLFGELTPNKKISEMLPSISPPEFPNWTSYQPSTLSFSTFPGLEGFVGDSALLRTFLNICDDGDEAEPDLNIVTASQNPPSFPVVSYETNNVEPKTGTAVHQTDSSVKGGNTENILQRELDVGGGNDDGIISERTSPTVTGGNRLENPIVDDSDDDTVLLTTPTPSPDSTVGYVDDADLDETTFNLISLKQNCIQTLSQFVVVS